MNLFFKVILTCLTIFRSVKLNYSGLFSHNSEFSFHNSNFFSQNCEEKKKSSCKFQLELRDISFQLCTTARLCNRIKNVKGNCDFLSHDSDFFFLAIANIHFTILTFSCHCEIPFHNYDLFFSELHDKNLQL